MDSINRLNSIIEVLRRQVAESNRRMETAGKSSLSTNTAAKTSTRPGVQELKQRLRTRLSNLDPTDPDKTQKSQTLFLESVLVWEFGDRLLLDRRFDDLVKEIHRALTSNPDVEHQLNELLVTLPKEEE